MPLDVDDAAVKIDRWCGSGDGDGGDYASRELLGAVGRTARTCVRAGIRKAFFCAGRVQLEPNMKKLFLIFFDLVLIPVMNRASSEYYV